MATSSDSVSDGLEAFPVVITLPVQWGDHDAFGHVNNTVYLRWCESSRVEYMRLIGLWQEREGEGVGPILAHIACDFKRPVTYPDTVRIGARVTKIGNTSFRMEHLVMSEAMNAVAAVAHSTVVVLDYGSNATVRVPEPMRERIAQLEHQAAKSR